MSSQKPKFAYEEIDASPVKNFFVSLLTRDISLTDSILDLLDNCVDGIHHSERHMKLTHPYKGKFAAIEITGNYFTIHDNCGGIPWNLHSYAFRMGRSSKETAKKDGMIGVYGIGMKRAIFKMGKSCLISTQNREHGYEVTILPEWIKDEENWNLPVRESAKTMSEDGTTIVVSDLHKSIKARFGDDKTAFLADLREAIRTHYSFIIEKGFQITLNNQQVDPKPTKLIFKKRVTKEFIAPFMYETEKDGVSVFLAVGFTRPLPTKTEMEEEQIEKRYSSLDAGWTVLCNDRAVVYCDRTVLTGWGEARVPTYHNQFIAISGIVEFKGPPDKLPTTTTKRGIDAGSILYLQVKNKMREGMMKFTDYTNKWKDDLPTSKAHINASKEELFTLDEIKAKSRSLKFRMVAGALQGRQFVPSLPVPPKKRLERVTIHYSRNRDEVKNVSNYLFGYEDIAASKVGERCFEDTLKKANKL